MSASGDPDSETRATGRAGGKQSHPALDGGVTERLESVERQLLRENFADFARSVLQDNIALCDTKAGVLLAFTSATVLFSLDSLTKVTGAPWLGPSGVYLAPAALVAAATALLVSSAFSLSTVMPRLGGSQADDHLFWESSAYKVSREVYVQQMRELTVELEYEEKLVHLHILAAVCRAKYAHLRRGMGFGAIGFVILLLAELIRG